MDRLISEQAVLKILTTLFLSDERFKVAINSIKAIPSAYKGMTNGEVIETVFPDADVEYRKISVYVTISPHTNLVIFDKDWWNSPFKGEQDKAESEDNYE